MITSLINKATAKDLPTMEISYCWRNLKKLHKALNQRLRQLKNAIEPSKMLSGFDAISHPSSSPLCPLNSRTEATYPRRPEGNLSLTELTFCYPIALQRGVGRWGSRIRPEEAEEDGWVVNIN